jgi:hypothetical protein
VRSPLWRAVVESGALHLPPAARLVMHYYAARGGDDGVAWPSLGSVAESTGLQPRSVRRGIRQLEALGILTPLGPGRGGVTRYRVTVPECPARPDTEQKTPDIMSGGGHTVLPEHLSSGHNVRGGRTICPGGEDIMSGGGGHMVPQSTIEEELKSEVKSERVCSDLGSPARVREADDARAGDPPDEPPPPERWAGWSEDGWRSEGEPPRDLPALPDEEPPARRPDGVGSLARLESMVIEAKPQRWRTLTLGSLEAAVLRRMVEEHGEAEVARVLGGLDGEYERPLQAARKQLERREPW